MLMRIAGHEVRECFGGREAIQLAGEWRPDVMLLDLAMPETNGIEVAQAVRKNPDCVATVLVAITGMPEAPFRHATESAGFAYYLQKPVEHAELLGVLEKVAAEKPALQ